MFHSTRLIALSVLLAAGAMTQQTIDMRKGAATDGTVFIAIASGAVTITGWDRPEVYVKGALGPDATRLEFVVRGRITRLEVVPASEKGVKKGSVLQVFVPMKSRVRAVGTTTDFEVRDVAGALRVQSGSGDIRVSGRVSEVEARCSSGDVVVTGQARCVVAATSAGDVILEAFKGRASAETSSGDVLVKGGKIEWLRCRTVSGDVRLQGPLHATGTYSFRTHSGLVELGLGASTPCDLVVSTRSGAIQNLLGFAARKTDRQSPFKETTYANGEGGPLVEVMTFSGDVRLGRE